MAHLHLIVGPVGAGKSTFARQLCRDHNAVHLDLDDWMAELFAPDRPESGLIEWYVERSGRCVERIWKLTEQLNGVGTTVVLEIGLIQQHERQRFCERVDAKGYELTIYVLDAPRELRRERVEQRNHEKGETFSMVVPPHIFELASDLWEVPTETECSGRDVHFITTGTQAH